MPLNLELKLEVWDSPNSAGIVIDAVRMLKLALNNGIAGQLDGPSSYLMKSPHNQRPDDEARELTEEFIAQVRAQAPAGERATARAEGRGLAPAPRALGRAARSGGGRASPLLSCARGPPERLSIAQVTPYPWEARHEVNEFVERLSAELAERGHRVLIVAPVGLARRGPRVAPAIRAAGARSRRRCSRRASPRVLAVGQSIPLPRGPRRGPAPLPVDVSRTLERLLGAVAARLRPRPRAVRAQRRLGRAAPLARRSTSAPSTSRPSGCSRPRSRGRWSSSSSAASTPARRATRRPRELIAALLPRPLRAGRARAPTVAEPGAGRARPTAAACGSSSAPRRSAARCACSCARCGACRRRLDWEATIWSTGPTDPPARVARRLRERVRVVRPRRRPQPEELLAARRRRLSSPPAGPRPAPGLVRKALAAGAVPVASRPAALRGADRRRRARPAVPARRRDHARRPARAPAREPRAARASCARAGRAARSGRLGRGRRRASRRSTGGSRRAATTRAATPTSARRLARPRLHPLDLHMHTDHSPDCATPVEVLLDDRQATAGSGAIAITDHNEISGALEAREVAERDRRIKVIVAEEVKTADAGRGDRPLPRGEDPARA